MAKILCVDFDGVLHSYTSGWKGADVVADGPVPGAVEWLSVVVNRGFDVQIYSSRSKEAGGVEAMREALWKWGVDQRTLEKIKFPTEKPSAWLTIDDRAFRFEGDFPSVDYIDRFRAWNK